jgi:hypothetical protein
LLTGFQKVTAGVIVAAALALAGIGLYLSFEHVAAFAHQRLGFATLGKGRLFTLGVDIGIMVLIAIDLLMAWLKRPIGWIRYPVWLLTAATVVLNAASGAPRAGQAWRLLDYVAVGAHAIVPVLFIAIVEVARTSIDRMVRPLTGKERAWVPLHRWALAPIATGRIYRRMRLWGITSYPEMVRREQELIGYEQWLRRKYAGDLKKATEDELLPMTMAPYGYTVAQALALPDEQERAAEERAQVAERRRLEAETRREVDQAAAEAERIRAQGEVETVRAEVDGATGQARAKAQAQVSAAERIAELEKQELETAAMAEARARTAEAERVEAEARRAAAEADLEAAELERRAAEQRAEADKAERIARREEEAVETARAAQARRAAAEADRQAAEAERAAAEARKAAVEASSQAADATAWQAAALKEAENNRRAAAEAEQAAAEARLRAAEIEARAVELEDLARMTPRERGVRKIARMILQAGGSPEQVPLEAVKAALKVSSPGTASEYRQEAAELLASGYRPTDQ